MELATPGTIIFGLGGYINPAILSYLSQPNLSFTWNDKNQILMILIILDFLPRFQILVLVW